MICMYAALSTLPADVEASSTEERESCACVIRKSSDRTDPAALGSPCCALFSWGLLYQVQVLCCLLQFCEGEENTWLECEAKHAAPSSLLA